MRKFRFNLQRLLDYRESMEEKLLTELAAIRAQYDREMSRLHEIASARDSFRDQMKLRLAEGDTEEIKHAYRYLNELAHQVKTQELMLFHLAERRDGKTAEVIEAAKDRKALERLREYKLLEHKRETESHEQSFLDDIACVRHNRRSAARESAQEGR